MVEEEGRKSRSRRIRGKKKGSGRREEEKEQRVMNNLYEEEKKGRDLPHKTWKYTWRRTKYTSTKERKKAKNKHGVEGEGQRDRGSKKGHNEGVKMNHAEVVT